MLIETHRLKIIPLTYHQLLDYLQANNKLEDAFGLARTGRIIAEDVKDMVEDYTLPRMKTANKENYLFYTFWIVIDKSTNSIVAELGFKGIPDRNGEVEIGYGTMPDQRQKGFMTEAVSGMIEWASQRKDVTGILAETDEMNSASIRIVQKNGFEQFNKKGNMLWWRRKVNLYPNWGIIPV